MVGYTGDTSIPYAVATGKEGLVVVFEPNPATYGVLEKNIQANPHLDIIGVKTAILDVPSGIHETVFHYSDPDLCNGGNLAALDVGAGWGGHKWPVTVQGVNLLQWLKSNLTVDEISRIGFVKIDTEGYDRHIIRNGAKLFNHLRPILQVEVYDGLNMEETEDLFRAIQEINYRVYDFSAAGKDVDKLDLPLKSLSDFHPISGHDLLCIPN